MTQDAEYFKTYEFDVSDLEPQVVPPPKRHIIKSVKELDGIPVNRGFIGSDAGSWLEHLRMAAHILRGRKIHPSVVLNITPGTTRILSQALDEGLVKVFLEAECVVPVPNEGMECRVQHTFVKRRGMHRLGPDELSRPHG